MDVVAASRMAGLAYVGIVYDGPVPAYVRDVPAAGCDILATKVYWRFPAGAVRRLSVRDVVRVGVADLDAVETREAYANVPRRVSVPRRANVPRRVSAPRMAQRGVSLCEMWCVCALRT